MSKRRLSGVVTVQRDGFYVAMLRSVPEHPLGMGSTHNEALREATRRLGQLRLEVNPRQERIEQ